MFVICSKCGKKRSYSLYTIKRLKSNLCFTCSHVGISLSEVHKRKISQVLKGHKPWSRGKKVHTEESKNKIGVAVRKFMTGRHLSEETKKKLSEINMGRKSPPRSAEYRKYLSLRMIGKKNPWYGKYLPEKIKRKMSIAHIGEKNHQWRGGVSFEPYSPVFNKTLKEKIRERDNYRCQECFRHQDELFRNTKAGIRPYKLCVHHIDYDKKNNSESNLISLCLSCHTQTGFNREDWAKYFMNKVI